MLKSSKQTGIPNLSEGPLRGSVEDLTQREWLLTNCRGDFSFGSVLGGSTRKYHGWLVGSKMPPLERYVLLAGTLEILTVGKQEYPLSSWEFNHGFEPAGWEHLADFDPFPEPDDDPGETVQWRYDVEGITVVRRLSLVAGKPSIRIRYTVTPGSTDPWKLDISPLLAMRDFHLLRRRAASESWEAKFEETSLYIESLTESDVTMGIRLLPISGKPEVELKDDSDWWENVFYRIESKREILCGEDLQRCGTFEIGGTGQVTFDLCAAGFVDESIPEDAFQPTAEEKRITISKDDSIRHKLVRAADAFVVHRKTGAHKGQATIIAGYPWFGDWGRDSFIALEGLLLCTERYEEARQVLATFAETQRNGLIPNRFDDYGGECEYNSVDASLWYIHAADVYLRRSGDTTSWDGFMADVCRKVVDAFVAGTDYEIGLRSNGLVWCGYPGTQITWMDAKCGDVVFTPRHGQPVEINALWFHALRILEERFADSDAEMSSRCRTMADECREAFTSAFWNPEQGCLNDVVRGDEIDTSIRPNQVFAVSLAHSPIDQERQQAVMNVVKRDLLTPLGLRSLAPGDPKYMAQCAGIQFDRDRAYHNGTVWSWLIGPYCEAVLRLSEKSTKACVEVRQVIQPLLDHMDEAGIGTISEIFDGDAPHAPGGCPAQAWSVAELLRIHDLLNAV